jgi:NAD(P)-dependent dehydrogenase (short-subunit alcohol dehydrogenase family)
MAGRLEGKVAVITGGASGMGRASALRFLAEGAKVVIGDIQDGPAAETLAAAQAQGTSDIRYIRTDVAEESQVEAMVALAVREFGRLDCVFSNAGWPGVRGSLLDVSVPDFDRTVAVNLRGPFLCLKHGGRVLKAQGQGGSLIASSSTSALVKQSPHIYATSKAAILQLVREFACELGPFGIRVNTLVPGAIVTPMWGDQEAARSMLNGAQPIAAAGEAEDIANMALFLASDESRFVSGTTMVVDGGMVADSAARFNEAKKGWVVRT